MALPRSAQGPSGRRQPLRAIQTKYNGFEFRSRLEARWGVFFDTLGIEWLYEPEGFELPSGNRYLPDFYLPSLATWFEVKGPAPRENQLDYRLWKEFASHLDDDEEAVIAWGQHPDPRQLDMRGHPPSQLCDPTHDVSFGMYPLWDIDGWAWCVCPWCGMPGLAYRARGTRVCHWSSHFDSVDEAAAKLNTTADRLDRISSGDHPLIKAAYAAARKARFEYGQTPRP